MNLHELKIAPEYMSEKMNGNKSWEIRKNDRDFKVGDILYLREWCDGEYTGYEMYQAVDYVFSDNEILKNGYVILSGKCISERVARYLATCQLTRDEINLIQATLMRCNDQAPTEAVMESVSSINEKLETIKDITL